MSGTLKQLTDIYGSKIYPIAHQSGVIVEGTTLEHKINSIDNKIDQINSQINGSVDIETVTTGSNIVTNSNTTGNSNTASHNENTYLNHIVGGVIVSSTQITGDGDITVSSTGDNNIIIYGTNTRNTVGNYWDTSDGKLFFVGVQTTNTAAEGAYQQSYSTIYNLVDDAKRCWLEGIKDTTTLNVPIVSSTTVKTKSIILNNSTGESGQVLCSGGSDSNSYWATPSDLTVGNANKIYTTHNTITAESNSSTLTGLYLIGATSITNGTYNTIQTVPVDITHVNNSDYTGHMLLCGCTYAGRSLTATNATTINTTNYTTSSTNYIPFCSGYSTGQKSLRTDSGLKYNPSTNTLTTDVLDLDASGTTAATAHIVTTGSYTKTKPIIKFKTSEGYVYGLFPYGESALSTGDVANCRIIRLA